MAMTTTTTSDAAEAVLRFIKGGNLQPSCKPGFAHALKLSYNTIDKKELTVTQQPQTTLSYRYQLSEQHVPTATVGLLTAIMDELSTNACFAVGMPSTPGVSLQFHTELLVPELPQDKGIDVVNIVTQMGRTISHTRTDFLGANGTPLAFSSHVKYMPTGSSVLDFFLTNKYAFWLYESILVNRQQPPIYDSKHLWKDVLKVAYTGVGHAKFQITGEHVNPFGAMHGGCHAMLMEQVGSHYATSLLKTEVVLQAIQVEFLSAAKGHVEIDCETIGKCDNDSILHVRVMIQRKGRTLSEGKLRFVTAK